MVLSDGMIGKVKCVRELWKRILTPVVAKGAKMLISLKSVHVLIIIHLSMPICFIIIVHERVIY